MNQEIENLTEAKNQWENDVNSHVSHPTQYLTFYRALTLNCVDGRSGSPKCVGTPNCVEL